MQFIIITVVGILISIYSIQKILKEEKCITKNEKNLNFMIALMYILTVTTTVVSNIEYSHKILISIAICPFIIAAIIDYKVKTLNLSTLLFSIIIISISKYALGLKTNISLKLLTTLLVIFIIKTFLETKLDIDIIGTGDFLFLIPIIILVENKIIIVVFLAYLLLSINILVNVLINKKVWNKSFAFIPYLSIASFLTLTRFKEIGFFLSYILKQLI